MELQLEKFISDFVYIILFILLNGTFPIYRGPNSGEKKKLKDVACIKFTRCIPMMFCHITMKTNKSVYAFKVQITTSLILSTLALGTTYKGKYKYNIHLFFVLKVFHCV